MLQKALSDKYPAFYFIQLFRLFIYKPSKILSPIGEKLLVVCVSKLHRSAAVFAFDRMGNKGENEHLAE